MSNKLKEATSALDACLGDLREAIYALEDVAGVEVARAELAVTYQAVDRIVRNLGAMQARS